MDLPCYVKMFDKNIENILMLFAIPMNLFRDLQYVFGKTLKSVAIIMRIQ